MACSKQKWLDAHFNIFTAEQRTKNLRLKNISLSIASMTHHTLSLVSYPTVVAHQSLSVSKHLHIFHADNHLADYTKYAHLKDKSEGFSEKKERWNGQPEQGAAKQFPPPKISLSGPQRLRAIHYWFLSQKNLRKTGIGILLNTGPHFTKAADWLLYLICKILVITALTS